MKFGLTQKTNLSQDKINIITNLSQNLKKFFSDKGYGNDIEQLVIGVTSVQPEFEQFLRSSKPKYIESKTETHDGFSVEIRKSYEYGIKLEYNSVVNLAKEDIERLLAHEIMKSLSNLDSLPKKIKDFDKDAFKNDLEQYFKDNGLV